MKMVLGMILAFSSILLSAEKDTWNFDPNHTSISFYVDHLGISKIGGFMKLDSGSLKINSNDVSSAEFDVKIDVKSLNTGVEARDMHVKSKDFLEADKYPFIYFKSTGVRTDSVNKKMYIDGNLSIKNITKPVSLVAEPLSEEVNVGKGLTRGVVANVKLNRFDFGVEYGKDKTLGEKILDGGVGREISISISTELTKSEPKNISQK